MKVTRVLPGFKSVLFAFLGIFSTSQFAQAQRTLGVDASVYQGTAVNWVSNKNSGVVFAWSRADEGTTITDGTFGGNMTGGKNAGIYMGGYHFALPGINAPAAEATHFWNLAGGYIKPDGLSLMPMLDLEVFTNVVGAASYTVWANTWCSNIVTDAIGNGAAIKPFIYCSACNLHYLDSGVSQWFSDIANYNGESYATGSPWDLGTACAADYLWGTGVWHVWQYNDTAAYTGFPSEQPDADVYNGNVASLVSNCVARSTGPVITAVTGNTNASPGANITLSVTATSKAPSINYQWAFNGTNISGATTSTYTITNLQIVKAGNYVVTLTDTNPAPTVGPFISVGVLLPLTNGPSSAVEPAGMVNWWTMDGNQTDLFGTNDFSTRGVVTYTNGIVGNALHFDGTSTTILTGMSGLAVPWTACMWVNRQNTPQTSAGLFEDGTYSIKLEQYNGTHKVGVSVLSVGDYIFGSGIIVPVGTWTHLAFVGTSSGISFYENGVLQATLTNTFSLPRAYIGGAYYAGSGQYLDQMSGNLDEVMVFNRALTVTQINSIYTTGVSGLVRTPQITSAKANSSGGFTLGLIGMTGKNFTVYTSPDLTNWSVLTALANGTGTVQITDPSVSNNTQLFYRVSQKP